MQIKLDTKEKFHVITPIDAMLSATMTEQLNSTLLPLLQNSIKNVVIDMQHVVQMDREIAEELVMIQQTFYEQNASFVLCQLRKSVEAILAENELLDLLNVTPTESEAWDIVQMEEIERELLAGDEEENWELPTSDI